MRIIFLGPPGCGKGTQSKLLCAKFGIPQIATGDMLREATRRGDATGIEIKKLIDNGNLVPDSIIFQMLMQRLEQTDCKPGFLLDGFPRNLEQAKQLQKIGLKIDAVVVLSVPDKILISRILKRQEMEHRNDDTEEILYKRLEIYHQLTEPLINWYNERQQIDAIKFCKVDGTQSIDDVQQEILNLLSSDLNSERSARH